MTNEETLPFLSVVPAKAGTHASNQGWIPAYAGMTDGETLPFLFVVPAKAGIHGLAGRFKPKF